MHQCGPHRAECNERQQPKRRRLTNEAVDSVRCVDGPERNGTARRCYGEWNMLRRQCTKALAADRAAPRRFAEAEKTEREQRCQPDADARSKKAGFDRIAQQEEAAEPQCQRADPDRPARAEEFLDVAAGWRRRNR
jgi:hypothetical protein